MMDNNPRIQMTSLEIMNALIENDWRTMQTEVTAKSFGEDLCRLASSKQNPWTVGSCDIKEYQKQKHWSRRRRKL
ncbi:hypothetical protein RMCBS344292_17847 [Rhizopus microsporus]|nr:hypothetical protein RMCBS344292_17847 [Rhizopus microsporus]